MEDYFKEYNKHTCIQHNFVRSVLTFSQFKSCVRVVEKSFFSNVRSLVAVIPGIIEEDLVLNQKIRHCDYELSVPIPIEWIDTKHIDVCLHDLYALYLQRAAWDK